MLIPYATALICLGQSFYFDRMSESSRFIFETEKAEKEKIVINKDFVRSQYSLIESTEDLLNFLNIDGVLTLKIKNNNIQVGGFGNYLKQNVDREKTVELLIDVYHETETHTFPSYLPPMEDWKTRDQKTVGSHYIRSITYGGRLLISYQLQATKREHIESIKASVNANLQFSGNLDADVKGKLEKLISDVAGKVSIEIFIYATTSELHQNMLTDIDTVFDLVKKFPNLVKEVNNGIGRPLMIEIIPLSTIQHTFTSFVRHSSLGGVISSAADKLDDLKAVKNSFSPWVKKHLPKMTKDQRSRKNDFTKRYQRAMGELQRAISSLDQKKGAMQFDKAFEAYGKDEKNMPNKYTREFLALKADVEKTTFKWYPYTTAVTTYIRWGSTSCSPPSLEPLYVGFAGGTNTIGNGANIQCLRSEHPAIEEHKRTDGIPLSSIGGLNYQLPQMSGQVFCAFCVLQNATSTFVVEGLSSCPSESKLEYVGYVMMHSKAGSVSNPICLDVNPVDALSDHMVTKVDNTTEPLTPVWIHCPKCEKAQEKFLPCAVCSR